MDARFELYCITDQKSAGGKSDLEVARGLLKGGASCLQYRAKAVAEAERWSTAHELCALCKAEGVPFIVNDFLELALECGAEGLHLGQDDLALSEARAKAQGRLFLGCSTHSMEQALRAQAEGADYIGYGPLYATQTKERNVAPLGLATLPLLLQQLRIPLVAIGGIKLQQLGDLAQAGAQHLAVVTALTGASDIEGATREFKNAWKREKEVFSR